MFKPHRTCRACGHDHLDEVLDLGVQPLANNFCGPDEERAGYAPLKVLFCPKCTLAQLSVVVNPDVLYSKYAYVTSKSLTMMDHFKDLWTEICREIVPESVVEIGSNDGDFLAYAREHGAQSVCGIDPARNLVEQASARGLHTFCGVFDGVTAEMARGCMPPVDLVVARHVFCHADDWQDFIKSLDLLCARETLVVIEVPWVRDLVRNLEFDTIYHEHLSYLGIKPMLELLHGTRWELRRVVRFDIHGGTIALFLRRDGITDGSVHEFLDQDSLTMDDWAVFRNRVTELSYALHEKVRELNRLGKKVVGYGASAKSTVWVNTCQFSKRHLAFICDSTKLKWNTTSPGSDIPIVDEGAMLKEQPDYAVMFGWNYEKEILLKNASWRFRGGQFIVPIPEVRIV